MTKLSIIIPVYNQDKLLKKCLDSIPKREDIEIIIIDDGSGVKTKKVIEDYVDKFPTFVGACICKTNHGVSYARNLGIEKATGSYVMFVDSDDYIDGNKLMYILDNYMFTDYDMIFYDMEDNKGNIYVSTKQNKREKYGMFKIIRKEFIGNTRFPVGKQYAEDRDFHLALMDKRPRVFCTGLNLYHYNYPRKGSLCYLYEYRGSLND